MISIDCKVLISIEVYKKRLSILREIRHFLSGRDFLEVETPILSERVIPESTISLFSTAQGGRQFYLLPSPEYYMKQLLAEGWQSLFQIARCFRAAEVASPLHHHEFSMLEYYWVDHNYFDSIQLTQELLSPLFRQYWGYSPRFRSMSVQEAFFLYAHIHLEDLLSESEQEAAVGTSSKKQRETLHAVCKEHGLAPNTDDSWESLFNRLFLNLVEPSLCEASHKTPIFLYDYPAALPSLSQDRGLWTERWELYIHGIELANCYSEERNPKQVQQFFKHENHELARQNQQPPAADPAFPEICADLPPCSGTALGLDRLVMLLLRQASIHAVLPLA